MFLRSNDVFSMRRCSKCRDGGVRTMSLFGVSSLFWLTTPEAEQGLIDTVQCTETFIISILWSRCPQNIMRSVIANCCCADVRLRDIWSRLPFDSGIPGWSHVHEHSTTSSFENYSAILTHHDCSRHETISLNLSMSAMVKTVLCRHWGPLSSFLHERGKIIPIVDF